MSDVLDYNTTVTDDEHKLLKRIGMHPRHAVFIRWATHHDIETIVKNIQQRRRDNRWHRKVIKAVKRIIE